LGDPLANDPSKVSKMHTSKRKAALKGGFSMAVAQATFTQLA
jgi:hypothetical protein